MMDTVDAPHSLKGHMPMNKKILIAVDDSIQCRCCVRYALMMEAQVSDLHYTLFHVQPQLSHYLLDEVRVHPERKTEVQRIQARNAEKALLLLDELKTYMIHAGAKADRIDIVTLPKQQGTAQDIIAYAERGHYDAIVSGRRGLSKLQEMFTGSVTANLIEYSRIVPLWIIDGEITSNRILAAVDGSESSLKAVDHLAFMLSGNPNVLITFFHVSPGLTDSCGIDQTSDSVLSSWLVQGDKRCIADFTHRAIDTLNASGLSEKQIEFKTTDKMFNIGKSIVAEIRDGNYGTVVIGRSGIDKSIFVGSVSRYVINRATDCALWVVN